MLKWFETRRAVEFGEAMALEVMDTLSRADPAVKTAVKKGGIAWPEAKSNRKKKPKTETLAEKGERLTAKAELTLSIVEGRVKAFQAEEKLNFYQRSKLANAFLWKLQDEGCTPEYARQLTDWLTERL